MFDVIYDRPDPREYFLTLGRHNYLIPDAAAPVFRIVYERYRAMRRTSRLHIVDVGCSYGINASLHKFGLSMSQLLARYAAKAADGMSSEALRAEDARWHRSLALADDLVFTGLDVAKNAVRYAMEARILDSGLTKDLETEALTENESHMLRGTDLIISTGAVGYVGAETFRRVADATRERPWLALFVLRQFDASDIAAALADRGYVMETLQAGLFPQRRFVDAGERSEALARLASVGREPTPLELDGWYAAEFVLMRPEREAQAEPLERMLPAWLAPTATHG